jgi:site-specific recombinase XerD
MKRKTLADALERELRSLATTLRPSTVKGYRCSVRHFLNYLSIFFPTISEFRQLQRDPHIQGWLEELWKQRPSLSISCRTQRILHLRVLVERLAEDEPHLASGLFRPSDVPHKDHYLPRPLSQDEDQRLQQELRRRADTMAQALLLMRLTGLRIGELVDLAPDCLRELSHQQWSLHVPLGKLHTERWVPVDEQVQRLVQRLSFLNRLAKGSDQPPAVFLLDRPHGRQQLLEQLRSTFHQTVYAAGIRSRVVPHQLRHTYATEMLRIGMSFPAVMKLLGHVSPEMTLRYVEITQADLQREYFAACARPRHTIPTPPALSVLPRTGLAGLLESMRAVQAALETVRRGHPETTTQRKLAKLGNRLSKIVSEIRQLIDAEKPA